MRDVVFVDIDTQFDFMSPKGRLYVKGADDIVSKIGAITRFAAKNGILIISSVDTHTKNDPEFKSFPRHCIEGTSGQKKIFPSLLRSRVRITQKILTKSQLLGKITRFKQVILEKNTYDVFSNFNLIRLMRPFRRAFVYGVALDYCVKYAVLGLRNLGIEVYLVSDATKPVEPAGGRDTLSLFKRKGVKFISTKALLAKPQRLFEESTKYERIAVSV